MNDKKANINELKEIVKYFCEERDWDQYHNPKDISIGIVTEASELLELFRFKTESQIKEIFSDTEKLKEVSNELADVLFFVLRFSQKNNIDLTEALKRKVNINERKYPKEVFKGINKKYTEV